MFHSRSAKCPLFMASLIAVAGLSSPSAADPVEDFYKGKTITIHVGYSAGGTYDAISRMLGQFMGKHIPGTPSFIVRNMPGSGSLRALMYLYEVAPKDGTALGVVTRSYPTEPVMNPTQPKYDPSRFAGIGSTSSEVSVAVTWHTSPIKTFDDMMKRDVFVGASSVSDDTGRYPLIARNLTGAGIKLVLGYPGGNEITAALEKGEVDARFGWSWGSVKSRAKDWLDGKKINIVLQQGMHKAPDLPDVPFIMDMAKNATDRTALEFLFAPQAAAWPMIAPPAVPRDRVEALRRAFDATMKDPEFLAAAAKRRIDIEPVTGAEMEALNAQISAADRRVIDRAKQLAADN